MKRWYLYRKWNNLIFKKIDFVDFYTNEKVAKKEYENYEKYGCDEFSYILKEINY